MTWVTRPPPVSLASFEAKVPMSQDEHVVAPGGEVRPAPQGVQSSAVVEKSFVMKVPATQPTQPALYIGQEHVLSMLLSKSITLAQPWDAP